MISDGGASKAKVVDLKNICIFIVDNFCIWNHLSNENYVWIFTFEIWFFQMTSDGETTKTKLVDVEKLCTFLVHNFFIWNHLSRKTTPGFSHIWNSNSSNDFGWINDQNQSCRSWKVINFVVDNFFIWFRLGLQMLI